MSRRPSGFRRSPARPGRSRRSCVWVGNTLNLSLRVDYRRNVVSVAAKDGNLQVVLEALASIALPLVAQRSGSLVLHASAACIDGSAVMLCAESGSGKSSLLMGLVAAGWEALSEDQCVDRPRRRRSSSSLARPELGATEARRAATAARRRADATIRGARQGCVGSRRPGRALAGDARAGSSCSSRPVGASSSGSLLPRHEVIGALARHATWLQRQDDFAPAVLPGLVKLGMSVPGFRMRMPRQPDWLEHGVALLAER